MYNNLDPRRDMPAKMPRILTRDVYFKGQTIIEQNTDGNRAFYIDSGRVEIIVRDGSHTVCVSELGPGEIFGEMALIENNTRSATVRALEDTTVSVIAAHDLESKIDMIDDPAVNTLIHVFVDRLRQSNHGQINQYRNFAEFQDRITGLVEKVSHGVDEAQRTQFRNDVMPLLEQLDDLLSAYQEKLC